MTDGSEDLTAKDYSQAVILFFIVTMIIVAAVSSARNRESLPDGLQNNMYAAKQAADAYSSQYPASPEKYDLEILRFYGWYPKREITYRIYGSPAGTPFCVEAYQQKTLLSRYSETDRSPVKYPQRDCTQLTAPGSN